MPPPLRYAGRRAVLPPNPTDGGGLPAWSARHPSAVFACTIAIVLLAILAVAGGLLPRRMMPYIESPIVGVITLVPGASAAEVELYISKPIEERLTDAPGMRYLRSTSQDGISIVTVEFPYGSNMARATQSLQALVDQVRGSLALPGGQMVSPYVTAIDPLNLPVLSICLTGDRARGWTPEAVREFAENDAVIALKQSPSVQTVQVFGGQRRQVRVVVDRDRLAGYGLTIGDLRAAIEAGDGRRPAGVLTNGPVEERVEISNSAPPLSRLADIPLVTPSGLTLRLSDVATVVDGVREQRSGYHFVDGTHHATVGGNNEAVELSVIANPGAAAPAIVDGVRRQLRTLEAERPGLHAAIAYDNTRFVDVLFANASEELAIGVLLCAAAVLIFLGNARCMLISIVTIPVSMSLALLLMAPFGFGLNSSTLVGLLISVGRLVDDSVIDLHAIQRRLNMGEPPQQATVNGIVEVRRVVAASTLMLAIALVPLLFCGGITQMMFVGLVYPIIFGQIASFLVSLTLTPALASRILKPRSVLDSVLSPAFSRMIDRLDDGYCRLIRVLLRNKGLVLAGAVSTIVIGAAFYNLIGSEMMPLADTGQAYGVLEMQPGTSYAATAVATSTVERLLTAHPEVRQVSTEIGYEPDGTYYTGYATNQVNAATMMITLTDKDSRRQSIWNILDDVQRQAVRTIPNLRRLQIKEMGSDVMASAEAPVQILVTGPDPAILTHLAGQMATVARATPGASQVATSWGVDEARLPPGKTAVDGVSLGLDIDAQKAAAFGLTTADISAQAQAAMGGDVPAVLYQLPNRRPVDIDVRYRDDQRATTSDLMQMPIFGKNGQAPLSAFATTVATPSAGKIEHDGLRRSISVLTYYRPGGPPSMDLTMAILNRSVAEITFPQGYGVQLRGDMTQMMDSFARLLRGLTFAIVLIFLVLAAQFGGFVAPLQMVLSIPLELAGVFAGLWLAHQSFSSVSILAIIVLSGIDMTTAILLIDQIRRRREEGLSTHEAIALGCRDRLRPILMTAGITILTMLPLAVCPRTGLDAYQPLGTVLVAGLITGTLLSLLVLPVMNANVTFDKRDV